MGLTAMLVGAVSGTGIHMLNNALHKVPLSRQPWFHVGYFFLGAYIGQKWVNLEKELVIDINEIRADKGLPPMVGTNAWVKYKPEADSL
ncbi:hypothetical protein ACHAWO_013411 [Cyclotella atomus]|uniref:Uncharacterized protein n=1 Tax=Cyclotella atomus TaxID=382360 RepID=A0ABD3Q0U2_9STRA